MTSDMAAERAARHVELALAYRLFAALHWGDLGDGHITARDPERLDSFWVLRAGVSFDRATVDDLVLIGPDGIVVDGAASATTPTSTNLKFSIPKYNKTAFHIHWPIHEARPDVVAAAHTHTHWGTPFAAERRLLQPISQEACAFHDNHSLFDDDEVNILGLDGGKRIAAALGDRQAVILANHGLLTVGGSVAEAVGAFVMMERVCEVHLKASRALPISPEAARRAKQGLGIPDSFRDAFDYLVARHLPDTDTEH